MGGRGACHPGIRTLLVEKTDRLYRNLEDWVLLDELNIEIHLVKEALFSRKNQNHPRNSSTASRF